MGKEGGLYKQMVELQQMERIGEETMISLDDEKESQKGTSLLFKEIISN